MQNRRKLVAIQRIAAADASKVLIAAPAAGFALRIFKVIATIVTSAAQQVDVGHDGGGVTKQAFSIPASAVVPTVFESEEGFLMDPATAFSAKPAAAGVAVQFFIEYQIEQKLTN